MHHANASTYDLSLAEQNLLLALQNLQAVEGDLVLQNNPNLVSLAGAAQTLTSVKGQVNITSPSSLADVQPQWHRDCSLGTFTLFTDHAAWLFSLEGYQGSTLRA